MFRNQVSEWVGGLNILLKPCVKWYWNRHLLNKRKFNFRTKQYNDHDRQSSDQDRQWNNQDCIFYRFRTKETADLILRKPSNDQLRTIRSKVYCFQQPKKSQQWHSRRKKNKLGTKAENSISGVLKSVSRWVGGLNIMMKPCVKLNWNRFLLDKTNYEFSTKQYNNQDRQSNHQVRESRDRQ